MFRWRAAGLSIQGGRAEQQDTFRIATWDDGRFFLLLVADGMGGHVAGATASAIAADAFVSGFRRRQAAGRAVPQVLRDALEDANASLAAERNRNPGLAGMGTTLAAAVIHDKSMWWISVGDSPLWLMGSGALRRLNEDHSFRAMPEVAGRSMANMLQSCLNGDPIPLVDARPEPIALDRNDVILLASDGVLTLSESSLQQILIRNCGRPSSAIAQAVLHSVEEKRHKHQDNCTAIVVSSETSGRVLPYMAGGVLIFVSMIVLAAHLIRW